MVGVVRCVCHETDQTAAFGPDPDLVVVLDPEGRAT